MGLICKLFGHRWNGCRCTRCGQSRNEEHQWVEAVDECTHTCAVCGITETVPCDWYHCRCKRCGALRDEQHLWLKKSACEQVCRLCEKERETHSWKHVDRGIDRCERCGQTHHLSSEEIAQRDEEWEVTDDFDASFDDLPDYPMDQD